jgi:hypothetical protein
MLPKGNWPRGKEAEQGRLRVLVTDIGNVPLQSQTKRDIAIKNNSLIPWTVAGIQSDCGCAVYKVQPERIEPGAIGTVSLEYRAPDSAGTIDRKVLIVFREEQAPRFICRITGFVEPWCYAMPKEVDFGSLARSETTEMPMRTVVLKLKPGAEIDWERSPMAPDWLHVKVVKRPPETDKKGVQGGAITIQITPIPPKHVRSPKLAGEVAFQSLRDPKTRLVLPVQASIEPVLSSFPSFLSLGIREVRERFTTKLVLAGPYLPKNVDQSFIRKNIHVTHSFSGRLVVDTVPGEKPGELDAECHFVMPETPGFLMGEIDVRCEGQGVIAIPITARVDKSKTRKG